MLDFAQMDTQVPAFEVPTELNLVEAATPLPCPRLMSPQSLVAWTPARLLGALVMALLMAPSFLLAPAINRRRV
jgi:hypothetical protein